MMKSKEQYQDESKLFVNDALQDAFSQDLLPVIVISISREAPPVIGVSRPHGMHIDDLIDIVRAALEELLKDPEAHPIATKTPTT